MSRVTPNLRTSDRELFSYTSGRYLYNEQLRLAERHVEFNIEALRRVAAQSVGRDTVVHMRKLAEGGFNRVLLLTMNDGFEVIVKIPYSIAVPKQLTTESEVATLDFLRSNGIPVPRVYAWSSQAGNEVGCEYIIMEKATGKPLEDRWFNLTAKEQIRLVTSYAEIERKLFAFPFGSYGSIYYKDNLPQNLQGSLYASGTKDDDGDSQRFCIGPIADYMFWRGKRSQLEINRGPWKHSRDYAYSAGVKERDWTSKYGKPQTNDFPHNDALEGEIAPQLYVDLLDKYLAMCPYLLPEDQAHPMNQPTMRHPDLNPTNIYVSDSCEVSCIIDWQHTTILPLLLAAGNPPLFENPDPEPPKGYTKPTLPENYDSLTPDEKSQADELHRKQMLFYWYMIFNAKDNKPHFNALRYPMLMLIQHLVDRAGRPWTGNIVTLKGALLRVVNSWDALMSLRSQKAPCPVSFDPSDENDFYELEENWFNCNILVEHWRSRLDNLSQDGWLRNESFEKAQELNKQLKEHWIGEAENEKDVLTVERYWPFQDHEETDC
ncbi:Phosphotransferase enzyme [Arachnomyces sp. PD_36]|nr:Phosphotransferase enzyme [Arachnomyces sp. PD_36]